MRMLQEFKEFAIKGNAMDLAVGVIIGAAFGKIVDSIVKDLIMPLAGLVFGKLDFSNLFVVLGKVPPDTAMTLDALKTAGVPVFAYGSFITVAVNFVILAFIIFMMVRQINRFKRAESAAPEVAPATPEDIALLREIRDSLKR
ncbi:MAG: large conductance mechanosensitive channel protein MscL [Giesbergeria sp.]|nr:large conductance mechanosensitive channel protein MscL [Giesbergeria sp.]MBP8839312.1 large conductance mechanosensitive channel protein MscL [Giesbergeria sp.]